MLLTAVITRYERTPTPHPTNSLLRSSNQAVFEQPCFEHLKFTTYHKNYCIFCMSNMKYIIIKDSLKSWCKKRLGWNLWNAIASDPMIQSKSEIPIALSCNTTKLVKISLVDEKCLTEFSHRGRNSWNNYQKLTPLLQMKSAILPLVTAPKNAPIVIIEPTTEYCKFTSTNLH